MIGESIKFVVIFSLMKVYADRLLVHLPQLDNVPLQGRIDISIPVLSISECAIICDIRKCDLMNYNKTIHVCTIINNQTLDLSIRTDIPGIIYRNKENKSCLYSGYNYIWELDVCVRFYHLGGDKLTWEDSQSRCQSESGNLIVVDSEWKETILMPYLNSIHESHAVLRWWIGAHDKENEGIFTWISGVRLNMTYTNWDEGQPDNHNSDVNKSNADCLQYFFRSREQSFALFDLTCHSISGSICENKAFV